MFKFFRKASEKAALPPGTLTYTGKESERQVKLKLMQFNENILEERLIDSIADCPHPMQSDLVTWIHVTGIHKPDIIQSIGEHLSLHQLVQEDIVNTNQRPKIDEFPGYLFFVVKMLSFNEKNQIRAEQVSIVLMENCVITFQERENNLLDPIRDRIKNPNGKFRKRRNDYLAYTVVDAIVDYYFVIFEQIGEIIEELEEEVLQDPSKEILAKLYTVKRELIYMRKSVWPLREVINEIKRGEFKLFRKETRLFLGDLYDHTIQVIETIESLRDMVSGIMDIYLSSVSNRMNEVMKVLTIIATIFIPLTFIAGIYGMNFEFMPELKWKFAYPGVWLLIICVALVMFVFFRRRKWL